jgi:poly(A) polymerase
MSDAPALARAALAGRRAWFVGGAVRDRMLGRPTADLDIVVDGDPEQAARLLARTYRGVKGGAACFALSERFGAWRVVARDGSWQIDVERMRAGSLEADLALRDFTVNAIAEPIEGGAPIDPFAGRADLDAGRLRMVGTGAFADDPLRVLRLVRVAVELELGPEPETVVAARESAPALQRVSPERVFMELARIVASPRALHGLELIGELGAMALALPELDATRGVEQSRFHHRDVYGHTLEVLENAIALQADPSKIVGRECGPEVAALLAQPLADGLTRGEALRWGVLLHDSAKPATRAVAAADERVTFIGHDVLGAQMAREALARLRTSARLQAHVAALVRHHLRLGFLVHGPYPPERGTVFGYLRACDPVGVDVTLLSVCDRLATRGDRAEESIEAHLRLARALLLDALRWHRDGPPAPLLRGDELARELGIGLGPRVGELLEALAAAQYTGEVATREQAIAFLRDREPHARAGISGQ